MQPAEPKIEHHGIWPSTRLGWTAVVLTFVALGSWIVFPLLTVAYKDTYPVLDTWVLPVVAAAFMDAAAVASLLAVRLRGERSVMSIAALTVSLLAGVFVTISVVGGAFGGS